MIKRLMSALGTLLVCFCVGTLISQALLAGYLWSSWPLDTEKCMQMLAFAQSTELVVISKESLRDSRELAPEQPSFEDVVEARADKSLDLVRREEALDQDLAQLQYKRQQLAEQIKRHKQIEESFQTELAKIEKSKKTTGVETNVIMLQGMKPKQAKEQLVQMYDAGEIDQVVMLIAEMADSKRKKICGEFRSEEENEKLGEILRRIREGYPLASLAEDTQKKLGTPGSGQR